MCAEMEMAVADTIAAQTEWNFACAVTIAQETLTTALAVVVASPDRRERRA